MEKIYEDFFREMLNHQDDIRKYVDSLYVEETYSKEDLNSIIGILAKEELITVSFADNRAWVHSITFDGKHYFDNMEEEMEIVNKKTKIFISHSSKDKEYVQCLVELLNTMGLNQKHIFCSSLPGYDIRMGKDIFECLREQFEKFDLHFFLIHSENYYESTVSLNEMGAAWVLRNNFTSILLPGFDFSKMTGVIGNKIMSLKLDDDEIGMKHKLNQIYDSLLKEFSLDREEAIIWEQNRDKFIDRIKQIEIIDNEPKKINYQEKLSKEAEELLSKAGKTADGVIMEIKTKSGTVFQVGNYVVDISNGARGIARMEAAVTELIKRNYVIPRGKSGEILNITDKGYKYLDAVDGMKNTNNSQHD